MVGDSAVELNPGDVETGVSVTETSSDVDKNSALVGNVSLTVGSNTAAASEAGLAVIAVAAEAAPWVWLKTGARTPPGEMMGGNLEVTSDLVVDEGCCGDTATAAAGAVAGTSVVWWCCCCCCLGPSFGFAVSNIIALWEGCAAPAVVFTAAGAGVWCHCGSVLLGVAATAFIVTHLGVEVGIGSLVSTVISAGEATRVSAGL